MKFNSFDMSNIYTKAICFTVVRIYDCVMIYFFTVCIYLKIRSNKINVCVLLMLINIKILYTFTLKPLKLHIIILLYLIHLY